MFRKYAVTINKVPNLELMICDEVDCLQLFYKRTTITCILITCIIITCILITCIRAIV